VSVLAKITDDSRGMAFVEAVVKSFKKNAGAVMGRVLHYANV